MHRYAYLCGNENRERIDFVSIIMAKELIRVPRVLGESYNSVTLFALILADDGNSKRERYSKADIHGISHGERASKDS